MTLRAMTFFMINARNIGAMALSSFGQYDLALTTLGPAFSLAVKSLGTEWQEWYYMIVSNLNIIIDSYAVSQRGRTDTLRVTLPHPNFQLDSLFQVSIPDGSALALESEIDNLRLIESSDFVGTSVHYSSILNCAAFSYNIGDFVLASGYFDTLKSIAPSEWLLNSQEFVRLDALLKESTSECDDGGVAWLNLNSELTKYYSSFFIGDILDREQRLFFRKRLRVLRSDWFQKNRSDYTPEMVLRVIELNQLEAWSNAMLLSQLEYLKNNVFDNEEYQDDGWNKDDWKLLFEIRQDLIREQDAFAEGSDTIDVERGRREWNLYQRNRENSLTKLITQSYFEHHQGWWEQGFQPTSYLFSTDEESSLAGTNNPLNPHTIRSQLQIHEAFVGFVEITAPSNW